MRHVKETGQVLYLVEWESEYDPGLWLGGFLFKRSTHEDGLDLYAQQKAKFPKKKWRLVRHTITNRMEVLMP